MMTGRGTALRKELNRVVDRPVSLYHHLAELRRALLRGLAVFFPAMGLGFWKTPILLPMLLAPWHLGAPIIIGPMEGLAVRLTVSLTLGLFAGVPSFALSLAAFVRPGLTSAERGLMAAGLPLSLALFAAGSASGYLLVLPAAARWLMQPVMATAVMLPSLSAYLGMTIGVLVWCGVSAQIPLVMWLLSRIGIIRPAQWRRRQREALMAALIAAAVLTPTVDPIGMLAAGIPLVALYELGVLLAMLSERRGAKTA